MGGLASKKVLVLTSSTGGGHNMRANALQAWSETPEGRSFGLEVKVHHALEATHPVYSFGVTLYNRIQQFWPKLHHLYFNFLEHACMHDDPGKIWGRRRFTQMIRREAPDVIVSTHGHLNHGFVELAKQAMPEKTPRTVIYCGELAGGYGFSRHWVNPRVDLFIGAVKETCEAAAQIGMPDNANWVGGFLLKPPFYQANNSEQVQRNYIEKELGLDPEQFILVLSTGLNGANNHMRALRALEMQRVRPQVVAMCGRKTETIEQLLQWQREHPHFTVRPMPYYGKMHALLRVASAVVARSGTGTTSEAVMSECPIIFNGVGGIMPQEMITVKYCRKRGFGEILYRTHLLPSIVRRWMAEPAALAGIRTKMRAFRPERHPLDILDKLRSLAG